MKRSAPRKARSPSRRTRSTSRDWEAIQGYYDAGHSIVECKAKFGFSNGAWDRAKQRGDIKPRGPSGRRWVAPLGETTRKVEQLLAQGLTNAAIARELGISTPTVSYHARRLGLPPDTRFSKRVDWASVQAAHDRGMSIRECAQEFGFSRGSWHQAVQRGAIKPRDHRIPLEELLVSGRRTSRGHLKGRLIKAGLKDEVCEECGVTEWRGVHLSMQLHHVNGVGDDNRLENIMFLCPNCHSQTDTWGGRNGHRKPKA